MAGIRMTGMASGLPPNIVDQIIEAERIPVKQMEVKKNDIDERYKLVQDLETKVSEIPKSFADIVGIRGFTYNKLTSGDESIVHGTADPNESQVGTWMIEVTQLAQKAGAVSNGFPDLNAAEIGVGYIKFNTVNGEKEVYIGQDDKTLEGVAKAINRAGIGIRASVINDRTDREAPYKLMVTGLITGKDNDVQFPVVYMLDGDQDFYFDKAKPAQNAKIKVDGFEFETTENQAKEIIPGVVLDLKQAVPGKEIAITIKEDVELISGKVKSFVDAYNGVLSFIQNQHKLQKDKAGRERLGPMGGDGLLRTMENSLRRLITNPQYGVDGPIKLMNQIGVEFNRNGTLNFSQEKFNKELANDPKAVAKFLRGDGLNTGFVPAVRREIGGMLNNAFGSLAVRKRTLQDKIRTLDERIERKQKSLEKREEQLRQKFANLEATMAKLNQQGSSIGGLNSGGGNNQQKS